MILLALEVSMLERMFKPQVTSALTRAESPFVGSAAGAGLGGVCEVPVGGGVLVVEDDPG